MKYPLIAVSLFVLLILGAFAFTGEVPVSDKPGVRITLHTTPTCGCCQVYARYLERLGYYVDVDMLDDQGLALFKEDSGVPHELGSCHTLTLATPSRQYIVEGHVPNTAIEKLVADAPDIVGIGMAGMPSGSPGMPGAKTAPFDIYEIHDGAVRGDVFISL